MRELNWMHPRCSRQIAGALAIVAFSSFSVGMPLSSWGQTSGQTNIAPQRLSHPHKRPSAANAVVEPAPSQDQPTPAVPEQPKWPAFDHPAEASVVWDSHGLTIGATNSSLQQIMRDVSTAMGVKVDGMNADQRVFGNFGPGQARDVLSQLLQGSGYNVIMIGDQGKGAPRQILLSLRQNGHTPGAPGNAQPRVNNNGGGDSSDDEPDEPPMPQPEENPIHPNFQPGAPPRSPQQILQEMQQRQQQQQQNQPQPQE
jgi:hypothetical protein